MLLLVFFGGSKDDFLGNAGHLNVTANGQQENEL